MDKKNWDLDVNCRDFRIKSVKNCKISPGNCCYEDKNVKTSLKTAENFVKTPENLEISLKIL